MSSRQIFKFIGISALAGSILLSASTAPAKNTSIRNLDAGFVLSEMSAEQRVSYIEGIVDGLAYARFVRDKPNEQSYLCVMNWYDREPQKQIRQINAWLKRHTDKPVSVLLHAMIKRECGK